MRYRPVIVIGHALHEDIAVLEQAGFMFNPNIVLHYLDTQEIARYIFQCHNLRLRDLCDILDIERTGLHISGNDATYTLVALLKMASLVLARPQDEVGRTMAAELDKLVQYANEDLPSRRVDSKLLPRRCWARIWRSRAFWISAGILSLALPFSSMHTS
jgi:DNA polymerase III alpha subunit (gram-positive type)